ncbi:MAG: DUF86 domain-containing protein [Nanoarchaeota archaeon]
MQKKQIDKEKIKNKILEASETIDSISEKMPENFEDFENLGFVKDGIYKRIEFAIQNIIDICYLINSGLKLGIPEVEDDIFSHLKNNNILSKKTMNLIEEMKGFRNILVHKYGQIEDDKAFESITNGLKDFETIFNELEKFLKNN